ncbi:MAG: conserved membrane protein of unknown function [Promethearchaeota archaeon]|nr:MAG: conserved membrane protein of unknown function [Candidatus Lokiarchaeota archaeon]
MNTQKLLEKKAELALVICVIIMLSSGYLSSGFQNDFGKVDVQEVHFNSSLGDRLVGKLYRPKGVTVASPAPGILALHGFNNDKDVERPGALELARAGFVVLALDQAGHGDSGGYLLSDIGSYLDGYSYLQNLAFVDGETMGVFGHSMGASRSRAVAQAFPDHDAIAVQAFAPSADDANYTKYNNLLHLWATWEEFGRSWDTTNAEWIETGLNQIAENYNVSEGQYDYTYGSFEDGTARRHALMKTTHPGLTANSKSTAEIVAWMLQALMGMSESEAWTIADPAKQVWIYCEVFGMIAALVSLLSIIPLAHILTQQDYFKEVVQPMPERIQTPERSKWWIFATINTAIGGVTYVFFAGYLPAGFGGFPNPLFTPIHSVGIATGFMLWFLINAGIAIALVLLWYKMTKKQDRDSIDFYDLGATFKDVPEDQRFQINWNIMKKTVIIAVILFAWMYFWVALSEWLFTVEFRGIWTMMKTFTVTRAGKFWGYIWPVLVFFLINGGILLFGQLRMKSYESTVKTYTVWWFKICYAMLAGLITVVLIQYAPMWFGGSPILNDTPNAPMMPIQLFSFIPLAAVLFFLMIYFYRRTGKIYLGSLMASIIAVWFQMTALVIYF